MKTCKRCGQQISNALLAKKKKQKSIKITRALRAAVAAGLPVGRPRKFDHRQIARLRKEGLSIRKIAKRIGSSTYVVQHALATDKEK